MSDITEQAAHIIAPHISTIAVLPLTTTTAGLNLAATGELGTAAEAGKFVTLVADTCGVYYFMNSSDAGTVDPTNSTNANATRCFLLPANTTISFVLRSGFTFLRARSDTGTGYVRAYVSSKPANELVG